MSTSEAQRAARERDFYRSMLWLLDLDDARGALEPVLHELVALTDAERGFLELYRDVGSVERTMTVSVGLSAEQTAQVQAVTSQGIAAAALSSGKTLHTPAAMLDPRFADSDAVQRQQLEAVLCVPLSFGAGVLYLEGKRGGGPFTAPAVAMAEDAAKLLGPVMERTLSSGARAKAGDRTRPWREKLRLDGLAGGSEALAAVFQKVSLVAPHDLNVLLQGETGTGKTALARAIHDNSPRRAGPFVELNCAAIPADLFESELFGAVAGAFTGARNLQGRVKAAETGTLFLDEVGELPLGVQAKLLQLLQSRQYYVLGNPRPQVANVRVVAASNQDLEALVEEKRFRDDLFHRLNAFGIRMPSLTERRDDIGLILDELYERVAFELKLPMLPLSRGYRAACEAMDWPGNVRQLRSRLEQAMLTAVHERCSQVEARHLGAEPAVKRDGTTLEEATRAFQKEFLRTQLAAGGWNVKEVARRLDVSRSQLYATIKALGLEAPKAE